MVIRRCGSALSLALVFALEMLDAVVALVPQLAPKIPHPLPK
jgi:hypothetical protein